MRLRGGEGDKGLAINRKNKFFWDFFLYVEKVPTAIKLEGGGGIRE